MKLRTIFWKYCFRYFIAFLFIMLCCLLLAGVAYGSIEKYVIQQNQLRLEEGVNDIQQNIAKINMTSDIFRRDSYFETLCGVDGELPPEKYLNLKYANDQFRSIGMVQSFFAYDFGLFRDNNLFVSSKWCSYDLTQYYGSFIQASAVSPISMDAFREQLFIRAKAGPSFWRLDSFTYNSDGQFCTVAGAILCMVTDATATDYNSPYVLAFVMRPEDVEREILTSGNLKDGIVRIVNGADGNVLLDTTQKKGQAAENGNYHFLKYSIPDLNWKVTIGFPESIIAEQCRQIRTMIVLYVFIGILLMITLTLYFSFREYANVKDLFGELPDALKIRERGQNEYDVLQRSISSIISNQAVYERRIEALALQNRAIVLENLIVRGVNTQEEKEMIREFFPGPLEYFCVALVSVSTAGTKEHRLAVLCIQDYFHRNYPYAFVNVPTGTQDELFLFSMDPQDAPTPLNIRHLFTCIVPALTEDIGLTFTVGISAVGTDTANVSVCCKQARQVIQAYAMENQNVIETYHVDINAVHENIVDMEFVDKFYSLLLCAEREAIHRQFIRLVVYYRKMPFQYETHKQQIFYTIRNVIYSARLHLAIDDGSHGLPYYKSTYTVQEMADVLEKSADDVCGEIENHKKSKNSLLRQRLLAYIEENYADPCLSAGVICQEIGISEKYLYQFIKEQTGETFSAYLEHIRIQKAKEYLKNTDMSNEKIAASTGFAAVNTFYRVFNKRTGVSPGIFRSGNVPL